MDTRVGQKFGNFSLVRHLGRGGYADVYLGEHIHLKNHFAAIKIFDPIQTKDEDETHYEKEAFRTEAQRLVQLIHPNIVRVWDYDIKEGTPFLVMEYAPNGSLRNHHIKGSRLSLGTIVHYVNQIASALQYIHDNKLIHRDIKQANMLLGLNNTVLLSDIGIAVVAHRETSRSPQIARGTPPYMAPEQWDRQALPASDQYSLGIVVYEWICGFRPFIGSEEVLEYQHKHVTPPSLRKQLPSLSPSIEEVVMTSLAKDARHRFASIVAFANALEQACLLVSPIDLSALVKESDPKPVPSKNTPASANDLIDVKQVQEILTNALPSPIIPALGDEVGEGKYRPSQGSEAFSASLIASPTLDQAQVLEKEPNVSNQGGTSLNLSPLGGEAGITGGAVKIDHNDDLLVPPPTLKPAENGAVSPSSTPDSAEEKPDVGGTGRTQTPPAIRDVESAILIYPAQRSRAKSTGKLPAVPPDEDATSVPKQVKNGNTGKMRAAMAAGAGAGAGAAAFASAQTTAAPSGTPPGGANAGAPGGGVPPRRRSRRWLTLLLILLTILLLVGIAFASPGGQQIINHIIPSTTTATVTITPKSQPWLTIFSSLLL